MKVLLVHPTGNQNSRQAAAALAERGRLAAFVTSLHVPAQGSPWRFLPAGIRQELARRDFGALGNAVRSVAPLREATRLFGRRLGLRALTASESGWAGINSVYRAVDRASAEMLPQLANADAVYAYEYCAYEVFSKALSLGRPTRIYELPIGYWRAHRRICLEEANRRPDWAHTWRIQSSTADKHERRDRELSMASTIIVPSDFVARTLTEYPDPLCPVHVVPYGFPPPVDVGRRRWYQGGELKVLFVGGLSQRKGLSYLLDAVEPLKSRVDVTIIGNGPAETLVKAAGHRVIGSMPHAQVLEAMRSHDLLVLPTLFEGLALVVLEAMSQGLPVLTTPNSGAASVIEDGKNGWIVPIRDAEAIRQQLESCIAEPSSVAAAGAAAIEKAGMWQWRHYRAHLADSIQRGTP